MYPVEEMNEMIAALQKACDQSLMIVRNEAGLTKCLDTIESLRAQLGRNTCAFSASSLANGAAAGKHADNRTSGRLRSARPERKPGQPLPQ